MTSPSNNNSLDDIFGSSPPHDDTPTHTIATTAQSEPSELPSLRRQHVTAGYRDGVSASKTEHVQSGFDAGFPVGAQLGMRAGTILGILEGVIRGYESRASSAVIKKPGAVRGGASSSSTESEEAVKSRLEKREKVLKLYQAAIRELDVQTVFAGLDGTSQELKPEERLRGLGDKAISTWEEKVKVAHWEEIMDALEMKDAKPQPQEDEQEQS
ncbi:essential protein Yae1 [Aspergillus pseudonomiae]|uniref:Protein YAE1 n=1 Tax=Aspergillus pseudonomiae TaxID=1506151 RepID=A0A5N7DNW0_9EURO|nr:essential protein Yae1 [Aspergillus pseudonomiae]KAE8407699.1 essential protein Yae1 [Aspergillus pseudonomiae]